MMQIAIVDAPENIEGKSGNREGIIIHRCTGRGGAEHRSSRE